MVKSEDTDNFSLFPDARMVRIEISCICLLPFCDLIFHPTVTLCQYMIFCTYHFDKSIRRSQACVNAQTYTSLAAACTQSLPVHKYTEQTSGI